MCHFKVVEQTDENWCWVENGSGKTGSCPINHLSTENSPYPPSFEKPSAGRICLYYFYLNKWPWESRYKNDLHTFFCCNMGITNRSLSICVNFILCFNFLNFVRDTNILITLLAFKHREELYYSITFFIIITKNELVV